MKVLNKEFNKEYLSEKFSKENISKKLSKENIQNIKAEDLLKIMNVCYDKSISGIKKVSLPIDEFAKSYTNRLLYDEDALDLMFKEQIKKCAKNGAINGIGGFLVMPVTIPSNIAGVLFLQMRMVVCAAYMAGFDLNDERTRMLVFACFSDVPVEDVKAKAGLEFGNMVKEKAKDKITGDGLNKINKKLGIEFKSKFSEFVISNVISFFTIGNMAINGGVDYFATKDIANRAKMILVEGNLL